METSPGRHSLLEGWGSLPHTYYTLPDLLGPSAVEWEYVYVAIWHTTVVSLAGLPRRWPRWHCRAWEGSVVGRKGSSIPEEARLAGGCTSSRGSDVPLPGSHFLRVYHVRYSGEQLLETWLQKDKSSEDRGWLTPVTCGPLGMVYTARLGSSKKPLRALLTSWRNLLNSRVCPAAVRLGNLLSSSDEMPTPDVP